MSSAPVATAVTAVTAVTTKAPAKLILSGEHAVVYGHPSIAIAVDLYAITKVSSNHNSSHNFSHNRSHNKQNMLGFDFANLKYNAKHTLTTLAKLKDKALIDYQRFINGECSISEVINKPFKLLQFAVSHFLDKLNITLPGGIDIKTDSSIPSGCGMGSSAATIMSLLYAVGNLLDLNLTKTNYIELGREAENLQHGKSSGLDLHITTLGGGLKYQNGFFNPIKITTDKLYLINTGQPLVTTGQCVAEVKKYFINSNELGSSFAALTLLLEQELLKKNNYNIRQVISIIKENHKLLNYIGVVPASVSNFIHCIEQAGGAAKVCGAGAVAGENAGAVIAFCPDQDVLNQVKILSSQRNYSMQEVNVDNYGIRIL
jgi:mevalonate kinase